MKTVIPIVQSRTDSFPFLGALANELTVVGFKPAIDFVLNEIAEAEIEEALFILPENRKALSDYLKERSKKEDLKNIKISVIFQKQNGENHSDAFQMIFKAKKNIGNEGFVVILPEIIFANGQNPINQLRKIFKTSGKTVLGIKKFKEGVFSGKEKKEWEKREIIVEKIARKFYKVKEVKNNNPEEKGEKFFLAGRFILTPDLFKKKPNFLEALNELIADGQNFYAYELQEDELRYGNKEELVESSLKIISINNKLKNIWKKYTT